SFSSHIRRHPPLTLFPYTTLFRSYSAPPIRHVDVPRPRILPHSLYHLRAPAGGLGCHQCALLPVASPELDGAERAVLPIALAAADRKSTRLNSSHVKISYAVFCLK